MQPTVSKRLQTLCHFWRSKKVAPNSMSKSFFCERLSQKNDLKMTWFFSETMKKSNAQKTFFCEMLYL